jgi:hypothetical protein
VIIVFLYMYGYAKYGMHQATTKGKKGRKADRIKEP